MQPKGAGKRSEPRQQHPAPKIFPHFFLRAQLLLCIKKGRFSRERNLETTCGTCGKAKLFGVLEMREGRTSLVMPHSVSTPSAPPAAKLPSNLLITGLSNRISGKVTQRGSNSYTTSTPVCQGSPFNHNTREADKKHPDIITNTGNALFKPSNYHDTETVTSGVAGTTEPVLTNLLHTTLQFR